MPQDSPYFFGLNIVTHEPDTREMDKEAAG
jgi:hypothetical protein